MSPVLCLLEITTAASGAWLSLWRIEDENPQGQQLPGESQLPVREKKPWPHPRWIAVVPQIPHRYTGMSSQVEMSSRERKKKSLIL